MCGFAAIFAYAAGAPPVDLEELDRINRFMIPRGPDGDGRWFDATGRLGLAHRRLAIIDPSPAGAQPMILEEPAARNGRIVISYNGEIYNYRELRAELEADGRHFRTQSDTEVLLHMFDAHGPEMLPRLRGMFAMAIWDESRRRLFLARDPFGIKPLYYADDGKSIRAASQVKALCAGGRVDTAENPAATVGFFLFGSIPEPHTVHAGIRQLPAGHWLSIGEDGPAEVKTYFDFRQFVAPDAALPDDEKRDRLREALADSVRHHMIADVPVGVFLSSGLDSATIMALAAETSGASLDTLTLGFQEFSGTPRDEVPLAEAAAAVYGTRQQTRWVTAGDFGEDADKVMTAMDQPSIDGINTYFVAKAAAGAGLKVALSGVGGDELFGGYDTFDQVPKLVGSLGRIPGIGPFGRLFRAISAPLIRHRASPKWASLFEYGGDYPSAYLLRRGLFLPWELPEFLDPDLVRAGWQQLDPITRLADTIDGVDSARAKVTALETAWYLRNQLLRDADWAGMAHSLEIRTPLVDASLFAAVAGLAATKWQMASTPKTPLPAAILDRPKTGFFIPVREWVMEANDAHAEKGAENYGYRGWARFVYERATRNGQG